jgi:hypothetical protein
MLVWYEIEHTLPMISNSDPTGCSTNLLKIYEILVAIHITLSSNKMLFFVKTWNSLKVSMQVIKNLKNFLVGLSWSLGWVNDSVKKSLPLLLSGTHPHQPAMIV